MQAILNSFLIVAAAEMGDRTQLLSLILTARYRKPWIILAGVLVATLANHALAAASGNWIATHIAPTYLKYALAISFIGFAFWILIPDKVDDGAEPSASSAFFATLIAFFVAEMGDKTQFATVALAARYSSILHVTIGTTLGMLFSNALAIFFGEKLTARIPMKWVRIATALLSATFGILILLQR